MNEIILSYEEYTKLISDKVGFQVGFTISISLLSALLVSIIVFILLKVYFYEEKR